MIDGNIVETIVFAGERWSPPTMDFFPGSLLAVTGLGTTGMPWKQWRKLSVLENLVKVTS